MERLTRDYDYDNTVTDTYTKRHHHLVQPRDGEACVGRCCSGSVSLPECVSLYYAIKDHLFSLLSPRRGRGGGSRARARWSVNWCPTLVRSVDPSAVWRAAVPA